MFEVDREQLEEFIGEDGYFSTMFAFDPIQSYKKGTCQCEFDRNMNPDEWKRMCLSTRSCWRYCI
ncbi:MAG: hypothetical protein ACLURV_05145 [Gallintestinimicrobium sp.]